MKKKLFMLVITGFLMMGTVNAASMWGTYKGNDIIRVTFNGNVIKPRSVPAINYNDKTMLPIDLLKDVGISYSYDYKTKTIKLVGGQSDSLVIEIKAIYRLSKHFDELDAVGRQLETTRTWSSIVWDSINSGNGVSSNFNTLQSSLSDSVKLYNALLETHNSLTNLANNYGYSISQGNDILNYYFDAIESLKNETNILNNYYKTSNSAYINPYFDATQNTLDLITIGRRTSYTESNKFFEIASNK